MSADLRAVTRAYLTRTPTDTSGDTGPGIGAGFDRMRWKQLAGDLGVQGMRIPEQYGGAGFDLAAELVVHEEMGRALFDGPFLATSQVAAALVELADDPANEKRLALIASGDLIAVPVLPVEEVFPLDYPEVVTAPDGVLRLTGSVTCVVDAQVADAMLVLAEHGPRHAFFWVDTNAPGVTIEPLETVDLTRRMAAVCFESTPVELLAENDRARGAVAAVRQGTALALAAECVGVADRALEMTVDYVRTRVQFGRPVGSFQAVKHKCADLLVELEGARSALQLAIRAVGANDAIGRRPESLAGLAVARIRCGAVAARVTREAIHLHGGIGFTWEHPAHRYYRRAVSNRLLLDSTGQQSRLLATAVLAVHGDEKPLLSFYSRPGGHRAPEQARPPAGFAT